MAINENGSNNTNTTQSKGKTQHHAPIIVLEQQVVFPTIYTIIPLNVSDIFAAVEYAIENKQHLIAVQSRKQIHGSTLLDGVYPVGTEIVIDQPEEEALSENSYIMARGVRRVEIHEIDESNEVPIATVTRLEDNPLQSDQIVSLTTAVIELFSHSMQYHEAVPDKALEFINTLEDPSEICYTIASSLPIDTDDLQALLEEQDVEKRLEHLALILSTDLQESEIRESVHHRLQDEMAANHREMYLREQLRVIQQELGELDLFQQELLEIGERIRSAQMSREAHDKAMKELSRLNIIPPMSPESGVIHTYIDWLLTIPWNNITEENLDIQNAEQILDQAHYGLDKVKARIVEHIAVRKLASEDMKSPILCFVGPPGVGKTSLGQSIAEALGRKFLRISLGGVRDEAEIRGHRRTYIGALPGRIIQQMQRAETINPVFMLDEIDKMSADFRGDPASALLEVLDPEQNSDFIDHYLEVPYDLSKVTFITTANDLYSIPEALEDRLEVIDFKGYTEEEKIQIARRFLIPKQLKANGVSDKGIQIQTSALEHIIRHYTFESGVRNLEREIATVFRKIAKLVATQRSYPKRITSTLIEKYLGPPQVVDTRINREDTIGIVTGLVWTSAGGDTQTIEVSLVPGKGNLTLTGQLGDVLQESAQIALSYLRSRANDMDIDVDDFDNYDIHVHLPEGAVPKDGPSAGITLATALISAFTEQKIRCDFAMTGELTLRGHVLPVGGVAEKVMAARRAKIQNVILSKDNEKDMVDVPKPVRKDINIMFVEDMQEVIDLILFEAPEVRQRDIEAEARNQDEGDLADGEET